MLFIQSSELIILSEFVYLAFVCVSVFVHVDQNLPICSPRPRPPFPGCHHSTFCFCEFNFVLDSTCK